MSRFLLPNSAKIRLLLGSSGLIKKPWCQFHSARILQTKNETKKEAEPFPYMTSRETKWTSEQTFEVRNTERFKYEPQVILICLGSLLIYFGVLREENELDNITTESIQSGPTEEDLIVMIKNKQNLGEDASEYEMELKKLIIERLHRDAGKK